MRYFLVGFMGSGKTYWGPSFAARLGLSFVDLDSLIETRESCSISQIFAEVGESGFRYLEQLHLHSLLKRRNIVVATGGGTPIFLDNMDWMNYFGVTVYLKAAPEILQSRLLKVQKHRPLISTFHAAELMEFIHLALTARSEFYKKAQIVLHPDQNESTWFEESCRILQSYQKPRFRDASGRYTQKNAYFTVTNS